MPAPVASFAEAWIEIGADYIQTEWIFVASFAEAWIEIKSTAATTAAKKSPPSRRRGLKYRHTPAVTCTHVASFAEAWIEIRIMYVPYVSPVSRLLRGGVD